MIENIDLLDQHDESFIGLGYEPRGELGLAGRRYYAKGGDNRTHQIHAFQFDNLYEIERHLAVRDFLRTHPTERKVYAAIKIAAAEKYPRDIEGYCDEKDEFVQQLEKQALRWHYRSEN